MRVLLSTFGSRGDVEPMAGLAAALKAQGAEPVVCAPPDPEFAALMDRAGARLAPAFTAVRQWIADAMANRPPMPLHERAALVMREQYAAISAAAEGCDAILGAGLFPSSAAAQCVAEERGLPHVHATYCPLFLPSTHHRPFPGRAIRSPRRKPTTGCCGRATPRRARPCSARPTAPCAPRSACPRWTT